MASSDAKTLKDKQLKSRDKQLRIEQLKSSVISVLDDCPSGITFGSFWGQYQQKHKALPTPKDFDLSKRSELLQLCSDVYISEGSGNEAIIKRAYSLDRRGGSAQEPRSRQQSLNDITTKERVPVVYSNLVDQPRSKAASQGGSQAAFSEVVEDFSAEVCEDEYSQFDVTKERKREFVNKKDQESNMDPRQGHSFYNKFYEHQKNNPSPRPPHPLNQQSIPSLADFPSLSADPRQIAPIRQSFLGAIPAPRQSLLGATPVPMEPRFMGVQPPRMLMNTVVNMRGPFSQGL